MSKERVLIVDDEEDTLKLLKMIVELSGYEAYTTINSMDALMMAQVEQPDVVLLDIMMPKLDGFQLCKMFRAHPNTRQLPIIFVSAYSALDLEERRLQSGADMVVPKPVGMEQLAEAIEAVKHLQRNIPSDIQTAAHEVADSVPGLQEKLPEEMKETLLRPPKGFREELLRRAAEHAAQTQPADEDAKKPEQPPKAERNGKPDNKPD